MNAPVSREIGPRTEFLDRTFQVALIIKGLDGVLETIGGMLLLVTTPQKLQEVVVVLTQHELSEDPRDAVSGVLTRLVPELSTSKTFAVGYLISHGLVKVVLVLGILGHRRWAYPFMIGCLLLFLAYQCYRYSWSHSPVLLLLTLFDACVLGLTCREYRKFPWRNAT